MEKIAIIGCGARITGLAKKVLSISNNIEIVALYDTEINQMDKINSSLGIKAQKMDSLEDLLALDEVSWVMIGSYNALHANHIVDSFAAGKNVFCEKPIATNLEDCKKILIAKEKFGKQFMLGFTLRYSNHYRKIKELLDSGEIGDIISLEFNETIHFDHGGHIKCCWRGQKQFTGTHLLEKCCHDVDLVNWMVGDASAKYVSSFGGINFFKPENEYRMKELQKGKKGQPAYCAWPKAHNKNPFTIKSDVIDNQVAIIEFDNQVRATFHTNLNTAIPERRLYIIGTHGTIRSDLIAGQIELQKIGYEFEREDLSFGVTDGHGGGDDILSKHFTEMVLNQAPSLTSVEDGVKAAVTCFAIDQAMDERRVVDASSLWDDVYSSNLAMQS
ncbi:MAG: oxidoreductase [Planctomycetota bacterium]|nr:MAG: oxidoreductase [Planctomycetota bacterium]